MTTIVGAEQSQEVEISSGESTTLDVESGTYDVKAWPAPAKSNANAGKAIEVAGSPVEVVGCVPVISGEIVCRSDQPHRAEIRITNTLDEPVRVYYNQYFRGHGTRAFYRIIEPGDFRVSVSGYRSEQLSYTAELLDGSLVLINGEEEFVTRPAEDCP